VARYAKVKGQWASLPTAFRFYHPKKVLAQKEIRAGKKRVGFETKFEQAVGMLTELHRSYKVPVLAVADSS
jgi:hypothetical protein